jgi:hypothetical protein
MSYGPNSMVAKAYFYSIMQRHYDLVKEKTVHLDASPPIGKYTYTYDEYVCT